MKIEGSFSILWYTTMAYDDFLYYYIETNMKNTISHKGKLL